MATTHTRSLQHEIGQTRPFRSPAQEAAIGLLLTADRVRRSFTEVLAPHRITLPQYNVLRVLRGAGPAGLPTLDVAERLIEQTPGITRMMDRLEARGWVERHRCPDDRRQVLCKLTARGGRLLAALDEPMDGADEAALDGLTRAEQRELSRLLERVRGGLR